MSQVFKSYRLVKDIMDRERFERSIEKKIDEFGGLLDRDVASLLVVENLGKFVIEYQNISDLRSKSGVKLIGTVREVGKPRTFESKFGRKGKLARVLIEDDSGSCYLVLWDKDVELVERGLIKVGDRIRIINGYAKEAGHGMEVSKGKWGTIITE